MITKLIAWIIVWFRWIGVVQDSEFSKKINKAYSSARRPVIEED